MTISYRMPSYDYVIIVQARTASVRFPGKVLATIQGQPMILWQLKQLSLCQMPLLVTCPDSDRYLADVISNAGYLVYHHDLPEENVLERFILSHHRYIKESQERLGLHHFYPDIVRITADCPLIDHTVVMACIEQHSCFDNIRYVALAKEWPDGLDVEVIDASLLYDVYATATSVTDKEHVTPLIWRGDICSLQNQYLLPCPLNLSKHAWSVDREQDLAFVREVLLRAKSQSWLDVYQLLQQPDAALLKYHSEHKVRNAGYISQTRLKTEDHIGGNVPTWNDIRYSQSTTTTTKEYNYEQHN